VKRRRTILVLAAVAAACFVISALVPLGSASLRLELNARSRVDGEPGAVHWARGSGPFVPLDSLPLEPLTTRFHLQALDLPAGGPDGLRLVIEPAGEGAVVFLNDLRLSCRSGLFNRLWTIDPGRLSSGGLTVEPVKQGLWRISSPAGAPRIEIDLDRFQPVSFLRAETAAWFIFWGALLFITIVLLSAAEPVPPVRLLIYGAALLLVGAQAWGTMKRVPPGIPPDELAHVSYVIHLEEHGRFLPDYSQRFLYSGQGALLDHRNYLAHPPFYYNLLRPFVPEGSRAIVSRIGDLRLVNLALGLCGVALFFWVGCREPLPLWFHLYYAAALSSVPMVSYLCGSVNNDNLLLIAGGLAVWGGVLFLESAPRPAGLVLLGAGLSLALLVKATAGLQLIFFAGLVQALRLRRDRSFEAFRGFQLPAYAVICFVPLAWYLWSYATYGTFIPQFGETWYDLPGESAVLSFPHYLRRFFRVLALSWTGILSHQSLFRSSLAGALPLLLTLGLAAWAFFLRETKDGRPFFTVQRLGLIGLLLMMGFHFVRVYRYHLVSGYPGGMQARYYLPLAPCLLMLSFRPFVNGLHRPAVRVCLAVLIAALAAGSLWFYWFRLL